MPIIRVGAQAGSSEAAKKLMPLQYELNKIFYHGAACSGVYFETHDFFSIAIRISGKNKDFQSEGPEHLKKLRGEAALTIDLTIPEERWKNMNFDMFKRYVAEGIANCFSLLVEKSKAIGELVDETKITNDFATGLDEFLLMSENK